MSPELLEFGAPVRGYVAARPKHTLERGDMSADSHDCLLDPVTGTVERRDGMTIQGDTFTTHEENGILPFSGFMRSRRSYALRSASLADGYETIMSLYSRDDFPNGGTFPSDDDGYFGTVYVHCTNNGAVIEHYTLGAEFSATHYPTSGGAYNTVHRFMWVPYYYESGEGGYGRGAFEFSRRFVAAGARNLLTVGGRYPKVYLPGHLSTPAWWGGRFNADTASGSETNRLLPAGPNPPAAAPKKGATVAVTLGGNDAVWLDGDTYGVAMMYRKKDGSYTAATAIDLPNANNTAGSGVVVIGTLGGTTKYSGITYAIGVGPDDVEARIILRTGKKNRGASTDPLGFDPFTLYVAGVVTNNSQTTFIDKNGDDEGLLTADDILRTDHTQPRRGRYWGTGAQRGLMGYTRNGQQAFVIAPMGTIVDWSDAVVGLNGPDTSTTIFTSQVMLVRITTAQFHICRYDSGGAVLHTDAINLAGKTVQDIVDIVNSTTIPTFQGQWRAQLCPGADGLAPATSLLPSTWVPNAHGTLGDTFITCDTPGDFLPVPLAYKLSGSASIPANTVVLRKSGDRIYLGDVNGAPVALTGNIAAGTAITFGADCGDGTVYHATNRGYMRVFANSAPFSVYFRRTGVPGYEAPDEHTTFFTLSSPGVNVSGVSLAPEAFVAGNRRGTEARVGRHMGFVDIEGAAAVGFTKGVRVFANANDSITPEDATYILQNVEDAGGVTSDTAFVGGRGWAVYTNDEGVFAIDKRRAPKRISGDIHNYDKQSLSAIAFETQACRDAVDGGFDSAAMFASVTGSILHLCYRIAGGAYPQQRITMHFAPGVEASGVEELFDPATGRPYGWGAPCNQPVSSIVEISTPTGRKRLANIDTNAGLRDGRIDRIDDPTTTTDNGLPYSAVAYLAAKPPPWRKRWSSLAGEAIHSSPLGSAPVLRLHRLMDRSSYVDMSMETLGEDPGRETFEVGVEARSNGDAAEPAWFFSDTAGENLFGIALEAELADVY